MLTFIGNSPIVFIGPLCAWLYEKLGGWPLVFVVLAAVATVILVPVAAMLKAEIMKKTA